MNGFYFISFAHGELATLSHKGFTEYWLMYYAC